MAQQSGSTDRDSSAGGIVQRFERELREGLRPSLEQFLDEAVPADRAGVLARLLALEIEYRFRAGETPNVTEYENRFPAEVLTRTFADLRTGVFQGSTEPSLPADAPPAGPPPAGPRFEILANLGEGGMGVAWEARDTVLNRVVALKRVKGRSGAWLDSLRAEAQSQARFSHKHVVQVYELYDGPDGPAIVMEFVPGGTLSDALRHEPQPVADSVRLVVLLARAAHAAHEAGIVHLDLKPGNVLLAAPSADAGDNSAYGLPKIADFGLARHLAAGNAAGRVAGTPNYMAPEQVRADAAKIGPATDVYALGAILFELLTGRPPYFGAVTYEETFRRILEQPPPKLRAARPGVPRELDAICRRCLAKSPAERFAWARELADALERLLDRPCRRRRQILAGAIAALLGLGVVGAAVGGWMATAAHRRDRAAIAVLHDAAEKILARADQVTANSPPVEADTVRTDLEQKVSEFDAQLARNPRDFELRFDCARTLSRLARVVALRNGELENVRSRLEQARAAFAELAAAEPARVEVQKELADALSDLAVLSGSRGNGSDAEAGFREAVVLRRQIQGRAPGDFETRSKLRADLIALGEFLEFRHEPRRAEKAYLDALQVADAIIGELAGAASNYRARSGPLIHLGVLLAEDRPAEADQLFRQAIDELDMLGGQTISDPVFARPSQGDATSPPAGPTNLVSSLTTAAEKSLAKVTQFYARQATAHPGEPRYPHLEARYQYYEAMVGYVGRKPNNEVALNRCLALYDQLIRANPNDSAFVIEAARVRMAAGRVRLGSNQFFAVAKWIDPAVESLTALLKREPDNARRKWLLAEVYITRAGSRVGIGRAVDAADDWEKGFALNDALRAQWANLFSLSLAQARAVMMQSLRAGRSDQALAAADKLGRLPHASAEALNDCARVYCAASKTAGERAEEQRARAVELLRQAFTAGYGRDAVQAQTGVADPLAEVKKDPDFDPLRDRADFQQLIREMDKK